MEQLKSEIERLKTERMQLEFHVERTGTLSNNKINVGKYLQFNKQNQFITCTCTMFIIIFLDQWCENLGKWKIEIQSVEVKYCSDVYNIIFYVIKLYLVSQGKKIFFRFSNSVQKYRLSNCSNYYHPQ